MLKEGGREVCSAVEGEEEVRCEGKVGREAGRKL